MFMFIKRYSKYNKTTKERYTIYRLCESYRIDGYIRHRTIIGFGKLEELPEVDKKKQLALRVEEMLKYGPGRLSLVDADDKVEELALHFYHEIKAKKSYDVFRESAEWETVDMKSLKNSDAREIGAEWLCRQAFDQLGIVRFWKDRAGRRSRYRLPARIL